MDTFGGGYLIAMTKEESTEEVLVLGCTECTNDYFYILSNGRLACTQCEADVLNMVWDWTEEIEIYAEEEEE